MYCNSHHTDQELLRLLSTGDQQAFRVLYDRYRDKLYFFTLRIAKSHESAEDLVHDVFLKIWNSRQSLTEVDNFNAYLYRVASNQAVSGLRKLARQINYEHAVMLNHKVQTDVPWTPEELFVARQAEHLVGEAMKQLTDVQRKVYQLNRVEGMRQQEIAEKLSLSIDVVKKSMAAAVKAIQRFLRQHYPEMAIVLSTLYSGL